MKWFFFFQLGDIQVFISDFLNINTYIYNEKNSKL